jgi:uncharacterized protein
VVSAIVPSLVAVGSGGVIGFVLGLIGGGGSILATPLLLYAVGVASPHVAIGTAAVAVAVNALIGLSAHARTTPIKWRCAAIFTLAGILGTGLGAELGKATDGKRLLALFGLTMIVIGMATLRSPTTPPREEVRLTWATARQLVPSLLAVGLAVGLASGFFGIGGGFLIVPGLMLATGMEMSSAVAASLVAVSAFGLTTAISYASAGLVDWRVAGLLIGGGLVGGFAGTATTRRLTGHKDALRRVFAAIVIVTGGLITALNVGRT